MSEYRLPQRPVGGPGGDGLADVLERVLDKGLVIAGDIQLNLLDIEVLTLKVRLLVASADTAQQMGIDWWTRDPFLSSRARGGADDGDERASDEEAGQPRALDGAGSTARLEQRIDELEQRLLEAVDTSGRDDAPASSDDPGTGTPPDELLS